MPGSSAVRSPPPPGEQSQIFGDDRQVAEFLTHRKGYDSPGSSNPLPVDGGRLAGWHGPAAREADEVVDAHEI
jgi:hypothetical protein